MLTEGILASAIAATSNPDLETIFLGKSFLGGVGVTPKRRPHR